MNCYILKALSLIFSSSHNFLQVFLLCFSFISFDTSVAPLIYADQYIQFSTILPNFYFYGIGEHRDNLAHKAVWKSFTMWNRDIQPRVMKDQIKIEEKCFKTYCINYFFLYAKAEHQSIRNASVLHGC